MDVVGARRQSLFQRWQRLPGRGNGILPARRPGPEPGAAARGRL